MKTLKLCFSFLLLSMFSCAFAQSFYYTGVMADGLVIQMELELNQGKLTGHYYYDSVGIPLRLEGSLDNNQVRLEEYDDSSSPSQQTGVFTGQLSNDATDFADTFTGQWLNSYGSSFSFSLKKVAEYVDLSLTQGRIETRSVYPFFMKPALPINAFLQNDFLQRQIDFLQEGQEQFLAGELYNGWTLDGATRIVYYSADLVSLSESFYLYLGGAHGLLALSSNNLYLEDGHLRILELRDMFAARSDFMSILEPFILTDLRKQDAQWVIDGSVNALSEQDLSVFNISPLGLQFEFEPYLMGPWAQGSFSVLVPYNSLLSLIDEASPLHRFLN